MKKEKHIVISQLTTLDAADGRAIGVLINEPAEGPARGSVILAPVFGATARSMYSFAFTLAMNGFRVIRLDYRDHVGTGAGAIQDTRLSTQSEDITTVARAFPGSTLAAASLSCRPAARAVSDGAKVGALVLVTPVVDVQCTLRQVTGKDYFEEHHAELRPEIEVLDYSVREEFIHDGIARGFATLEGSLRDLSAVGTPVRLIAGDADPWVRIEDVRTVSECLQANGQDVELTVVEAAAHRLNRNPAVAMRYVEEMTRACLRLQGVTDEPTVPSFDELLRATSRDRAAARTPALTVSA